MMPTKTLSKDDVNVIFKQHSNSPYPAEMATEVKVVIVSFQRSSNNISIFSIVSCKPQGNNETCSFANDVCEADY